MSRGYRFLIPLFTCAVFLLLGSMYAAAGTVDFELERILRTMDSGEEVSVLIYLADRIDLKFTSQALEHQKVDMRTRHEIVLRNLRDKAQSTQRDLLDYLQQAKSGGRVKRFRSFWISNIVAVTTIKEEVYQLARRPEVERVYLNYPIEGIKPVSRNPGGLVTGVEPGLGAVRAPEVWALGYTGEETLVSHLDTGVDGTHPALYDRWRGHDPRYAGNPEWAWFDPVTGTNFPFDSGSHGTHTMGTVCGADHTTGDTVGVAFGAEWISAGVIDRAGIQRTMDDAILAFQWVADPDSNPATYWDVPDVNSNSWGISPIYHGQYITGPCDTTFWTPIDACEAAGVVVVFSAGNEGDDPSTLRTPPDRAETDYNCYAVGAVDGNDPSYPIAGFSSRGPSHCTPDSSETYKPEISAPGVNVRSCMPGGGYGSMSGTSMASPHINGVIALMRQANQELTVEQIKRILQETAVDLGRPGEDNDYGVGLVDAYEAVMRAIEMREGYGSIVGRVVDLDTGDPLPAGVRITNAQPPVEVRCTSHGYYYMYVPANSVWDLKAQFFPDYLPAFAQVTVGEHDTVTVDLSLYKNVPVILRASFGNPEDIAYRTFYARGSWDHDGFYSASWECGHTPMRDDGVYPDEMAGDGVFTCEVRLDSSMVNTYNWAVYSEDYGGEGARLQDGSGFQITDPNNPPQVPILEVNPSGHENNWTLTVEGDHGLTLELVPNYRNLPHWWAAEVQLEEGVTYTYLVKVMHSDLASYGKGGVGGSELTTTPDSTGTYTFLFDDSLDVCGVGARMEVEPRELEVYLMPGEITTRDLTISNTGDLPLHFSVRSEIEGAGGPDGYGYRWIDSDEPGGPVFNWVDISLRGDEVIVGDDSNVGPFALPFTFQFYGEPHESFRICSNGFISFTSTSGEPEKRPLPDPDAPYDLVAPFWEDLVPANGHLYWYANSDSAIVTWYRFAPKDSFGYYETQVILLSDGEMVLQYGRLLSRYKKPTVGIQNWDGTMGLQICHNEEYLHDSLAVRIHLGWLRVMPTAGEISSDSSGIVVATLDASKLEDGLYTGSVTFNGWDLLGVLKPIVVPVNLYVGFIGVSEEEESALPGSFALHQNYPNPFNPTTEIKYDLPKDSEVKLEILNILGQKVVTLVNEKQTAGYKSVRWNSGEFASGIYFYRLAAGDFSDVKMMTLLR